PYENLLKVLQNIEDKNKIAFLFGHNPGVCDLVNFLSKEYFENIPTCGIIEVDFDTKSWKDISKENSKFIFFEYPKKYK
ncbi:MAG: histidine phosphatase family protein, partial [Arcobacter sp.]